MFRTVVTCCMLGLAEETMVTPKARINIPVRQAIPEIKKKGKLAEPALVAFGCIISSFTAAVGETCPAAGVTVGKADWLRVSGRIATLDGVSIGSAWGGSVAPGI